MKNWAAAWRCSEETMLRRLADAGHVHKNGSRIPARLVIQAMTGEKEDPVKRLALAKAVQVERENRLAEKEIITFSEFEQLWTRVQFLPLREFIRSIPTTYDVRCNPDHADVARNGLRDLQNDALRILREGLTQNIDGNGQ